jgi:tetratricopeptide (TPR) repeat protein
MKTDLLLAIVLVVCLSGAVGASRWLDHHDHDSANRFAEEQLYLSGRTARRLTLAFNGVAADWYWMRSLQYVGRKIVKFEDEHDGRFELNDLSSLDLRLLASLLDVTTTLDPQFIPAYEYGALILPEVSPDQAIALLNKGIAANPNSSRLYQHLGYIYWQRKDYARASEVYAAGAKLPGAPAWMTAMAARMKAEGGSRAAAREMYQHLYESSNDKSVQEMVEHQLLRLDSLDERDAIRRVLDAFKSQNGRCVGSWREANEELAVAKIEIGRLNGSSGDSFGVYHVFKFDVNGAPLDPSGMPYSLISGGCDVDLDPKSNVAR